jgi:hypothetical protein
MTLAGTTAGRNNNRYAFEERPCQSLGQRAHQRNLEERLFVDPRLCLRHFRSRYDQHGAPHPFVGQLGRAAGFARGDPNREGSRTLDLAYVEHSTTELRCEPAATGCHGDGIEPVTPPVSSAIPSRELVHLVHSGRISGEW